MKHIRLFPSIIVLLATAISFAVFLYGVDSQEFRPVSYADAKLALVEIIVKDEAMVIADPPLPQLPGLCVELEQQVTCKKVSPETFTRARTGQKVQVWYRLEEGRTPSILSIAL